MSLFVSLKKELDFCLHGIELISLSHPGNELLDKSSNNTMISGS